MEKKLTDQQYFQIESGLAKKQELLLTQQNYQLVIQIKSLQAKIKQYEIKDLQLATDKCNEEIQTVGLKIKNLEVAQDKLKEEIKEDLGLPSKDFQYNPHTLDIITE